MGKFIAATLLILCPATSTFAAEIGFIEEWPTSSTEGWIAGGSAADVYETRNDGLGPNPSSFLYYERNLAASFANQVQARPS